MESFVLFAGDVLVLLLSLGLTLLIRYPDALSLELLRNHSAFLLVYALWIFIYFIFDLYGKQTVAFRRRLFALIARAHAVNALLAVLLFYFFPSLGITPRANLLLLLVISLTLMTLWRISGVPLLFRGKMENAVILGNGPEEELLRHEIRQNPKYRLALLDDVSVDSISARNVQTVILDMESERTQHHFPLFSRLVREGVHFLDVYRLYESIFDRVPLSRVDEAWFLENCSARPKFLYDTLKRGTDIAIGALLGAVALVLLPFIACAILLEDGRPVFYVHERVGKDGALIAIPKFRSMKNGGKEEITRVGAFLRKTSLDELPQAWSILKGDLSLVGPRPELPRYVEEYRKAIPYYDIRHLITPGLSGWAQMYHETAPKFQLSPRETEEKLSYDLYYVKNRSFLLDLKITLKTLKRLFLLGGV